MKIVLKTFKFHLTVLRLVGMYPPTQHKTLYKIFAYFMYFFFIVPVPVCGGMHLFQQQDLNINEIANNAFLVCELGCFIVKMLPFMNNGDEIRRCIYTMECPIFSACSEKQAAVIHEFSRISKRIYKVYVSLCMISVAFWAIKPMFFEETRLPLDIWLPYTDPLRNTKIYVVSYIMLVLGCFNGAISSGVVDPLIAGLAHFASCQIKILKEDLLSLDKNIELGDIELNQEQIKLFVIYNRIKKCVEHYDAVLNFVQHLEGTFSLVVFSQFFASVLVICISCLELSMVQPFTVPFYAITLFLSCMLTEVFLYCYYGTILFEENNTLNDAIYMCPWYNFDTKSKKALIILMERSKRPIIITAGKILDLSLVTFSTIIRRAYSLLAVLKNFQ